MLVAKNHDRLKHFYKKVALYQFFVSCFLFSLLYANLPYLLYGLPVEAIDIGKQLFVLLVVSELIHNLFNMSHVILLLSKYFKLGILTFLLLLLGVVANYLMISR